MASIYNEDALEQAALEWLEELGYEKVFGPDIAPEDEALFPERASYDEVILKDRLKSALARFNRDIPPDALEEAYRKITITDSPSLIINNQNFHRMITDGVDVEYRREDGSIKTDKVWLFDFDDPANNDWAAVSQFTIIENDKNRRPDIIIFVNGLPLVVFELKSATSEDATIQKAYNQLQTYKNDIPSLLAYNAFLIV